MDETERELFLAREPLFDRPEVIGDAASFEEEVAADFREIGASGRWYSRAEVKRIVLARLAGTEPVSLVGGYRVEDFDVRELGPGLVQVTYTLHGQGRVTVRSTLYRRAAGRWQAVFHQGTVVQGASPLPPTVPEPRHG